MRTAWRKVSNDNFYFWVNCHFKMNLFDFLYEAQNVCANSKLCYTWEILCIRSIMKKESDGLYWKVQLLVTDLVTKAAFFLFKC